ncbi:MAG: hypothetical protein ACTSW2_10765 [Alphaproteobacteria bacterium]
MNQSKPPALAVNRLPVLSSVREAYGIVLGEPGLLLRAIAAPYLLSILIAGLTLVLPASPFVSFLLAIAGLAPYAIFGVAWCRLTLLGPEVGRPSLIPSWTSCHWRYFGYLAALAISMVGLVVPPLLFGMSQAIVAAGSTNAGGSMAAFLLLEFAVILGTVYLAARLSFVFPAAAVDEIYRWRHAWAHTRGQGMRLLGVIVFSMIPAITVLWVVAQMLGIFVLPEIDVTVVQDGASPEAVIEQYLTDNAGLIATAQIAMTGMSYLVMAVVMSAFSVAFRISTGWVPAAAPPLAEV